MSSQLNDRFYKDGYEIAIANSKSILTIADLTAENKEFGVACSLNILSAEEAIKASFLIIKHYHKEVEIDDFDKIFKGHKTKHKHIKSFLVINQIFIDRQK